MLGAMHGLRRAFGWASTAAAPPAVFHLTHHKAGSQWVNRLLHALVPDRVVEPEVFNAHFLRKPVQAGKVYPTLYLTREQFESVPLPKNHRRFVVVRDLRDTLVSLYFSRRNSHPILHPGMKTQRQVLADVSVEDGLLYLLEGELGRVAQVQWSWVAAGEELVRYEDLLTDDEAILARVLLRHCKLGVDPMRFHEAVVAHRFEAWSGRKPGQEDPNAHERKGVAGDWRNHFTPRVADDFRKRYGSLLIATGYEKDFGWC
jgi:lipopolysaccharide transport system ATP-binding protein